MQGKLINIEGVWMVAYELDSGYHFMQLHPDDSKYIAIERYIDDIEFKIVVEKNLRKFAKLLSRC